MSLVSVLIAATFAVIGLMGWRARARQRRLERVLAATGTRLEEMQRAFQRFAPDDVVEVILHAGHVPHRAARREVTVFFTDILHFTAICERLSPEDVVELLNGYFRIVSQAVRTHRGRVAKFIGDGIMITFGAPERNPWQASDAVRAALDIRRAMVDYNERLAHRELPAIEIGMGIHQGTVIAGIVGSDELVEYTVIGDAVNTAARIESLAHTSPPPILVSASIAERLDARFRLRALSSVAVKGKSEQIEIFAVDDFLDREGDRPDAGDGEDVASDAGSPVGDSEP